MMWVPAHCRELPAESHLPPSPRAAWIRWLYLHCPLTGVPGTRWTRPRALGCESCRARLGRGRGEEAGKGMKVPCELVPQGPWDVSSSAPTPFLSQGGSGVGRSPGNRGVGRAGSCWTDTLRGAHIRPFLIPAEPTFPAPGPSSWGGPTPPLCPPHGAAPAHPQPLSTPASPSAACPPGGCENPKDAGGDGGRETVVGAAPRLQNRALQASPHAPSLRSDVAERTSCFLGG